MSLLSRKIIILGIIGAIVITGNILLIANWLNDKGIPDKARYLQEHFLTGTAISVILTLLLLLTAPVALSSRTRRCPVCDKTLAGRPNYCPDCGSRIT